ncbi:MAG: FAD binding domain-containing protein [Lentilitoribacter sp.]
MQYEIPTDLQTALTLYAVKGSRIIAGGTDVFPAAKQGHTPRTLIDLTAIPALSGIELTGDHYRIGAATTWSDIIKAELPAGFDALKQAACEVGSIQIQNAGTIGGNICNASPAADGVPPLLALDAKVELASAENGVRRMALSEFILNVRKTSLAEDEIVSAVHIPKPGALEKSAFEKLGSRRYLVISITMIAANITCDKSGVITHAKIAVGACSPVAQRLTAFETDIIGQKPENIEITEQHLSVLSPIDDVRGSGEYRMDVVAEQCKRAVLRAATS